MIMFCLVAVLRNITTCILNNWPATVKLFLLLSSDSLNFNEVFVSRAPLAGSTIQSALSQSADRMSPIAAAPSQHLPPSPSGCFGCS